jgi:hypothetical protein
MEEFR